MSWPPFKAISMGTETILLSIIPTIILLLFSNKQSTAKTPILEARTLSKHEGEPPL